MNAFRNSLCTLMAAALAAIAFPAAAAKPQQAPDKSFAYEFLLPDKIPGPNGTQIDNPTYQTNTDTGEKAIIAPVTVTVYIKNESPPSTAASNISSLSFVLSPSLVLANVPGNVTCPRALCSASGNTILVTNISSPIQAQEAYPVTLLVNTCVVAGEASISNVQAFTGSSFTGKPFSVVVGDDFFKVASKLSTRTPLDFTQKITPVVTGIACGNIACGTQFSIDNDDPSNQPYQFITGWRGLNADGTCSGTTNLGFFATNQLGAPITTDRLLHFTWASDPNSPQTFAYKVTRVAGTGWNLGWLLDSTSGQLVTIPAPICNGGLLPTEPTAIGDLPLPKVYGVLTSDVKPNTKTLKVDTGGNTPPTVTGLGLPIIVEGERMLVTSIDNSGWSVTRNASLSHPTGANVTSTPLPLLDNTVPLPYFGGTPAKMCMAWNNGANGTSAWIIDQSDGWTLGR